MRCLREGDTHSKRSSAGLGQESMLLHPSMTFFCGFKPCRLSARHFCTIQHVSHGADYQKIITVGAACKHHYSERTGQRAWAGGQRRWTDLTVLHSRPNRRVCRWPLPSVISASMHALLSQAAGRGSTARMCSYGMVAVHISTSSILRRPTPRLRARSV